MTGPRYIIITFASFLRCLSIGNPSCSIILVTNEYLEKSSYSTIVTV